MPAFLERVRGVPKEVATVQFGLVVVVTGFVGTFAGGFLGDALLKRTKEAYLWVSGVATLIAVPFAFVALTAGLLQTEASERISFSLLQGGGSWLIVMLLFMAIGWAAQRLAQSPTSVALQYVGLTLGVVGEALILQPMLWLAYYTSRSTADFHHLVFTAALITGTIFVGLTLTVFVTKKDFSFLRGALMIASFAALGVILTSMLFGFQLGALFSGAIILLMAGYILFQTSQVMSTFPPQAHVAASLMLFSTIATLFWYVLRLLMELNRR